MRETFDGEMIRNIFGWDDNISVVAPLPVGFPDESPEPRKRLPVEALLIKCGRLQDIRDLKKV